MRDVGQDIVKVGEEAFQGRSKATPVIPDPIVELLVSPFQPLANQLQDWFVCAVLTFITSSHQKPTSGQLVKEGQLGNEARLPNSRLSFHRHDLRSVAFHRQDVQCLLEFRHSTDKWCLRRGRVTDVEKVAQRWERCQSRSGLFVEQTRNDLR